MLWLNKNFQIKEKEMSFGKLKGIALGEEGRGRKLLWLPIPANYNHNPLTLGLHEDLSIGYSRNNKPKIINKKDDDLYLIVDTYGGYTRRGCGYVEYLKEHKDDIEFIAKGYGADGAAGRIGTWDVVVLKVLNKDFTVLRNRISGGNPSEIILIYNSQVYTATRENISILFDSLDIDIPFIFDEDYHFENSEWNYI